MHSAKYLRCAAAMGFKFFICKNSFIGDTDSRILHISALKVYHFALGNLLCGLGEFSIGYGGENYINTGKFLVEFS